MHRCAVVGSLNTDIVTRVDRFPNPGETITGLSFATFTGGKGGNQTVALARLGASVSHIGKVGADVFGESYLAYLDGLGADVSGIERIAGTSTGTATIEVDGNGENHIIIVPGANALVDPAYVRARAETLAGSRILLLQLEIPLASVLEAAGLGRERGLTVILDPAPAQALPPEIYPLIDYLTPNETEAALLTGLEVEDEAGIEQAARVLLGRGARAVIIKAGRRGAYLVTPGQLVHAPGFSVEAVDTTAAGDSFNAGLAFALMQGREPAEALRYANAVAAISTTKVGAQSAMPTAAEVEEFLRGRQDRG